MGQDWSSSIMLDVRFANHSAVVAVSVLSHGPHPDSSSINKVTNFLVKGFYWNRFQVSSKTSFQAFLQMKNFHIQTLNFCTTIGLRTVCLKMFHGNAGNEVGQFGT
jgi:hypothetical protein